VLGTSPDGDIEDITELLPDEKILEDVENIETQTEVMVIRSHRVPNELLEYLRSVMGNHYREIDGSDSVYIMISCPRVLPFERYIVE